MGVKGHDMGEDTAEGEGLRWFAESVDERVIPGGAVSNVTQDTMQIGVRLFQPLQHRSGGALRFWRIHICTGPGEGGGPDFFGEDNVFQQLPESLVRLTPREQFYNRGQ